MGKTRLRWIIGVLAALCAAASPARAQLLVEEPDQTSAETSHDASPAPVPRSYPERTLERARPGKPADLLAREAAAADAAAAACAAGEQAGCSDLGRAHHRGEGRPQNRPVAELIYRKACAGGEGSACYRLASLLRSIDDDDPATRHADQTEAAHLTVRACRAGWPEACDAEADDLLAGTIWMPDPAMAETLRRDACGAGHAPACRKLAALLLEEERGEAGRREAEALLDRQCRAGDREACSAAKRHWTARDGEGSPVAQGYEMLACEAGNGWACSRLGMAALRRDPPDRAAAQDLLDRACAAAEGACRDAADLRDHPALVAACAEGVRADCIRLGTLMAERGGPFADRTRALELLGAACEAEPGAHCLEAAALIFDTWRDTGVGDAARAQAYLEAACTGGTAQACRGLADALGEGRCSRRTRGGRRSSTSRSARTATGRRASSS